MNNKNLKPEANDSTNSFTGQNVPAEMVELLDEDLQQLVGGVNYELILELLGDDD